MNPSSRVIRNSFVLNLGHVLAKFINLGLVLIMTHMFGPEGYGLYSFGLSYVMMFMIFSQFGLNYFLVQHIAIDKSRAESAFATAFPLVLIFSALTVGIVNSIPWLFGWAASEKEVVLLFSLFLFFDSISRFTYTIFRAFEQMAYESLTYVLERFMMLLCAIFFWFIGASLPQLLVGFIGVELVKSVLGLTFIHTKFINIRFRWDLQHALFLLRQSLPFALMIAFGAIMIHIDSVMLKYFHTDAVVGIYSTGRRLVESLTFIPETVMVALFPSLSALFIKDRKAFVQNFQQAFVYMVIVALPITILLFSLAPQIIHFLFPPEFADAQIALRWLSVWLGILFLKYMLMVALNAMGKQRLMSGFVGLALLANILLNAWLIPRYMIVGACIATIVSESITALGALIALRRLLHFPRFSLRIWKALIAGAGTIGIMSLIQENHLATDGILILASYVGLSYLLGVFNREDIQRGVNAFRNRGGTPNN